ncbi:MAG: Gx transporter family protein [Oscillospiraceae bacterium]|nr:Gx transporter family protein [Oscillospiraceae bacterium]
MTVKRLTLAAIFTAIALAVYVIEAMIPLPIGLPGIRLGLANTVTLIVLFMPKDGIIKTKITGADALIILLCRILLGAFITGRAVALAYSLTGGLFALGAQVITKRFVTPKQIWVCGALGAVFHNIGQILAAIVITGTPSIAAYLPILIVAGVVTGVITGVAAGFTVARFSRNPA